MARVETCHQAGTGSRELFVRQQRAEKAEARLRYCGNVKEDRARLPIRLALNDITIIVTFANVLMIILCMEGDLRIYSGTRSGMN